MFKYFLVSTNSDIHQVCIPICYPGLGLGHHSIIVQHNRHKITSTKIQLNTTSTVSTIRATCSYSTTGKTLVLYIIKHHNKLNISSP